MGGEPYLDSVRANLHGQNDDLDETERHARQAVAREPDLLAAWWSLLGVHMLREDVDQTLATMDEMTTRLGVEFDEQVVAEPPQWELLRTSPEWTTWQAAAN